MIDYLIYGTLGAVLATCFWAWTCDLKVQDCQEKYNVHKCKLIITAEPIWSKS